MNTKKIFVDVVSFQGNDKQNPIGSVIQEFARHSGEVSLCAEDADLVIVGTIEAAMTALSVSGTSEVVLAAVQEGWRDELTMGANLRVNSPHRFSMYSLIAVPEMGVDGAEGLFARLRV